MIMDTHKAIEHSIYFENDGEIDLLTGAMAPNRFNQFVKRDIDLANRNGNALSMISIKLETTKMPEIKNSSESVFLIGKQIETLLIEIKFKLSKFLRESDCLSRVSTTGFWLFINTPDQSGLLTLHNRIRENLPEFVTIEVVSREKNQDQQSWYEKIDEKHFQKS